jgi:hypothetical protein
MSESPVFDDGNWMTGGAGDPNAELVARIEAREGAPDQCTLHPTGLDDVDLMTHWLTADEGTYVSVESMR